MECSVCGGHFSRPVQESECASRCPHYAECDIPRCPNCFYENVLEPEWYARAARA